MENSQTANGNGHQQVGVDWWIYEEEIPGSVAEKVLLKIP